MKKKYPVNLTRSEREHLRSLIAAGTAPARKLTHARILLKADQSPEGPAWVDEEVAEAVEVSLPTVERVRRRFVEHGLDAALRQRRPRREYRTRLNGEQEAHLSPWPARRRPWAAGAGRCDFWPTSWSSCATSTASRIRRCARCLASAGGNASYSEPGVWVLRLSMTRMIFSASG